MTPTPLHLATHDPPARTLRLVHKHAHDVRNQLNSLELDLMLMGELASDPATLECVARLRAHLAAIELQVKSLVVKFSEPSPFVVAAEDLLRLWKGQVAPLLRPGREIEWVFAPQSASLRLDARAVVTGLTELTLAAWSRASGRPLTAALAISDVSASVSLREPGQVAALAPDLVGELDRLVTANSGRLEQAQVDDTSGWVTTFTFPLLPRREMTSPHAVSGE